MRPQVWLSPGASLHRLSAELQTSCCVRASQAEHGPAKTPDLPKPGVLPFFPSSINVTSTSYKALPKLRPLSLASLLLARPPQAEGRVGGEAWRGHTE